MAPVKEAAGPQRRQTFGARRKEKDERKLLTEAGSGYPETAGKPPYC